MIEEKLNELGYYLSEVPKPLAAYVPGTLVGDYIFTSGQLPIKEGNIIAKGKVGSTVTEEIAIKAAEQAFLNCLSVIKSLAGNLDKVEQIVKITVFVASAENFNKQPQVANGASELAVKLFGDKGKHARSAVGVSELPLDAPVEIEMIVKI